jgi:DNA-binding Lrp family transcriptional regulator
LPALQAVSIGFTLETMKKVNSSEQEARASGALERKWGRTLIEAGWLGFPSVILQRQKDLGLDAIDLNILFHLADHWWQPDNPPFPGKQTIADRMGVTARTVQRRIAALESAHLIERQLRRNPNKSNKTNIYHLKGLIEVATPYAEDALATRKRRKEEKAQRDKIRRLRIVRK